MGPIILFDKSILQAMSVDESVWFDHFFIPNISPIFFIETLADLEKKVKSGSTPEKEVGLIATKTPEMSGRPNVFHSEICLANLIGYKIPMNGRIAISGGTPVYADNKFGLSFKEAPEAEALLRWRKGRFLDVERYFAKSWRDMLNSMQFGRAIRGLMNIGIVPERCKTLENAKSIAAAVVNDKNRSLKRMRFVFEMLSVPSELFEEIIFRWSIAGCPDLASFAPYAAHVIMVDLFFYIATAASLISKERVTNKIDMAYLYYLPFCHIFTSWDRLHKRCAPLFMREDQEFVWGADMKEDLKKINAYYDKYPESDKEKGLFYLAAVPPSEGEFLISKLWDRYCPIWRSLHKKSIPRKDEKLIEHIEKFTKQDQLDADKKDLDVKDPDVMTLQKKIQRKRGKWWQVPKDLKEE